MLNLFLPTANNNFRARIITTPVLVITAILMVVFNSGLIVLDAPQAYAAISNTELLEYHNIERGKAGLEPLTENKLLSNSALQKALAMLEYDCWDHYCPEGKSPWEFFDAVGYDYLLAGENLAEGFSDIEDVMVAWMNSPTHKANVLKAEYQEVGFGIVKGYFQGRDNNTIVAVHFGTPQPVNSENVSSVYGEELLSTPVISDPRNGSHLDVNDLTIIGSAPNGERVVLYNNTDELAEVEVSGGAFSHRIQAIPEGEYNITAIAEADTLKSKASDLLTVTVDRSADAISSNDIRVSKRSETGDLTLTIIHDNLRTIRMKLGDSDILFDHVAGTELWEAEVSSAELSKYSTIDITTVDLAGNTWNGEISTQRLLALAESIPVEATEETEGQVLSLQTKSQINAIFLIILVALFGLDFLILALTGTTKRSARSHLHFALLIIIGIIVLTGALSGHVGQGLALN